MFSKAFQGLSLQSPADCPPAFPQNPPFFLRESNEFLGTQNLAIVRAPKKSLLLRIDVPKCGDLEKEACVHKLNKSQIWGGIGNKKKLTNTTSVREEPKISTEV